VEILNPLKASVREIVEFVLRSGSIDSQYRSSLRALEGIRVHSAVQKKHERLAALNGLFYQREVPVNVSVEYGDFVFDIDGRIDGLVVECEDNASSGILHIEEIKSTSDINAVSENFEHWHFAQAKCYGYMFALSGEFSEIAVHLSYSQIETLEERVFKKVFSFNELKQFFYDLIEKYYKWQKLFYDNAVKRNSTIKKLNFPFNEYRKGQREFAAAVYKTIFSHKKIFAQAPTGTGKTVSTVFPALKFVGKENLIQTKIFYATAKTITRLNAQAVIEKMVDNGLFIRAVSITAREKICISDEYSCTPKNCPFADGHFSRVNEALFEMILNESLIFEDILTSYARKFNVCPYELALDAAFFSDFIICDYNYIFDPKVSLRRFFSDDVKGDFVLLVDEAHNLSDRAREMFSAEISMQDVSNILKIIENKEHNIYKAFFQLDDYIFRLKRIVGNEKALIEKKYPEELFFILTKIQTECGKWISENENVEYFENVLEAYFKVLDFIRVLELFYNDYLYLAFYDDFLNFKIKLFCINPSRLLFEIQKKFRASVFFSATLTPVNYFVDVLGGSDNDNRISLDSPFNTDNLEIIIDSAVSTKYKHRDKTIFRLCESIFFGISKIKGNHLVFFPSYDYMEKAGEVFKEKYSGIDICIQPRNMSDIEKQKFLDNFVENPKENFVAFAVMGGVFSEGIDLIGNRLCGAVIVGVGLPLINFERNLIKEYYDSQNKNGFDYAYTYPGFNKVLQAAGRVIRTETDKGYILLIDSRFSEKKYKDMFPSHWKRIFTLCIS